MTLIKKPYELKVNTTIKVLLYGQPGIGKTTMALSAPQPLLLDFDNGAHRVNPMHQSDTVQITSWEDALNVLDEDLSPYKTLVIDTAGKMLDYISVYIIAKDFKLARKDGALTLQGFGVRRMVFQNFLKKVSLIGKHLVFVAHDKEEKDGETKFIRPEIGGSSAGDLIKEIDLVGYIEALGKKRTISFDPCEKFYGKNTCSLDSVIEIPNVVNGTTPNMLLSKIFVKYQESQEAREKTASEYAALLDLIKTNIEECADCNDLNDKAEWARSLNHIWDSKLQAAYMLKAKAEVLGCVINKTTKLYEHAGV